MLIYNTTYQVSDDVLQNVLIWIKECYIPQVLQLGYLSSPRLCRVLSHLDDGHSYSLQWEVESSAILHQWHLKQGSVLNEELIKIFKDKVVGFPTLLEVVE